MGVKLLINSLFRGGAEKQFAALGALLPHDQLLLLENEVLISPPSKPLFLSRRSAGTSSFLKTAAIPVYARRLAALTSPGDTVLSFMERANLVNILAARRSGHRAVVCERTRPSGEFSGLRGALMRPLIRRLYPEAAVIVANSAGVKADLAANFSVPPEKITVINNGCDTAAIAAAAGEGLAPAWARVFERPVICASGRLTAAKGHWHMLRIFSQVKAPGIKPALVLLGEGELLEYLLRFARGLGLTVYSGPGTPPPDADVYFAGFMENPYKYISKARLFALTSLWEGFPNALVEALACGAPVLSSDCTAGPREILSPGTAAQGIVKAEPAPYGVLLPALSGARLTSGAPLERAERVWAEKISEMLADTALLEKYSRAGLARAQDFELSTTAALWRDLLQGTSSPGHHVK